MLIGSMMLSIVMTVVMLVALRDMADPSLLKGLGAAMPPSIVVLLALLTASNSAVAGSDDIPTPITFITLPVLGLIGFAIAAALARRQPADQGVEDE